MRNNRLISDTAVEAAHEYPLQTDFQRPVYCLLGLPFDALTLEQAVSQVAAAAHDRRRCFLSTPNLNFVVACLDDGAFRDSVIRSDLSVMDGMPLVWLARLLGLPFRQRVAGATLFEALRGKRGTPLSVYFFGGPEGVAEQACARLNATPSGLVCAGFQSPGFGSIEDMSNKRIIDAVNAAEADFLVVALGAKKGQAWIEHNLPRLHAPVISHLGAVVNFVAGSVLRAPAWIGRMGCEWLWRIKEEPALWRRYFHDGRVLLRLVFFCVLPCALMRLRKRDARAVAAASVSFRMQGTYCTIIAGGAWEHSNLQPLRDAFHQASISPHHILLDFSDVSQIDSAGIGLLLLLYGHQSKIGQDFIIYDVRDDVMAALRLHGADYIAAKK